MKMKTLVPATFAAISALTMASTAALAAPSALTDHQLDTVSAGGGTSHEQMSGLTFLSGCSFGINCNGNGGSNNGNSAGLINVGNGNLAGSSIASGNTIYVSVSPSGVAAEAQH